MENKYKELRAIDVSAHTEKKANLSYLSWVWAVDQLLQQDPAATWEYREPVRFGNNSLMVFCTVNAFGKAMTAQLPVMDHKNKAIPDPDAFEVNKAMQRCLAKAIALHGIGLYIYAGEDLPEAPARAEPVAAPNLSAEQIQIIENAAKAAGKSVAAICKKAQVNSLADMPADWFDAILNGINQPAKPTATTH